MPFIRGKVAGLDKDTFFQGKLQFKGTGADCARNGGFCCNGKNTNARSSRISVYLIEHWHIQLFEHDSLDSLVAGSMLTVPESMGREHQQIVVCGTKLALFRKQGQDRAISA